MADKRLLSKNKNIPVDAYRGYRERVGRGYADFGAHSNFRPRWALVPALDMAGQAVPKAAQAGH